MQLFIQALLVIIYIAGTCSQKITFDNTDVGGNTGGRFYIDGTIGGNMTALVLQNWQPFIIIQIMRITDSRFVAMCALVISGATCSPDVQICQCNYNTTTDNVHFVVNGTASEDQYNATIRAQWQHQNQTNVYSNKNYTVPELKVEDTTTSVPITSTATIHDETTAATESSSPSSNMTVTPTPKPTPDDIVLIVCLSVIIPVVVIAVVIGIFCYCKKKKGKSQAVSNNGTGSTPKEEKPEHPK